MYYYLSIHEKFVRELSCYTVYVESNHLDNVQKYKKQASWTAECLL